jgi:hypothetical protein
MKGAGMETRFNPDKELRLGNPKWALYFLSVLSIVTFSVFSVTLILKIESGISADISFLGILCLIIALISAIGVYICAYEKLVYKDGIYKYYRPFGKNRSARADEIGKVKFLTIYISTKTGIGTKRRVIFFDKNKKIMIKITDDGTLCKSEALAKSLKYNRIKITREEKFEY